MTMFDEQPDGDRACALCGGRGVSEIGGDRCTLCNGTGRMKWHSPPSVADQEQEGRVEATDDGGPLREGWQIMVGPGHSGFGVYAVMEEYPDEGSVCLATIDPNDYAAAAVAAPAEGQPSDAQLRAFAQALGLWVEPHEAEKENGIPVECGISQDDADYFNDEGIAGMREAWNRAFGVPAEGQPSDKCEACNGTGLDPACREETCIVCGGSGRVPAEGQPGTAGVQEVQLSSYDAASLYCWNPETAPKDGVKEGDRGL